ncbi:MAG: tetratricopeptide repeat protein [Pseudomonadota bacterium]
MSKKESTFQKQDVTITARYGETELRSVEQGSARKIPSFDQIVEFTNHIRSTIINLLFFSFLGLIGYQIWLQIKNPVVTIEAISVPKTISDQGLSGKVIAHQIWDEVNKIQKVASLNQHIEFLPEARKLNIIEPDSGVSLESVNKMVRTIFKQPQTIVSGEITCLTPKCDLDQLNFRLRKLDASGAVVKDHSFGVVNGNAELNDVALGTLEAIAPYAVAVYFHIRGGLRWNQKATAVARRMYDTGHKDSGRAAALLGHLARERKDYDAARKWFSISTEIDDNYSWAWSDWGSVEAKLDNPEGAIEKFERAVEIDPDNKLAWYRWGNLLGKEKEPVQAIEKYKQALKIDPDFALAWNNIGNRYAEISDFKSAFRAYQTAIEKDPKDRKAPRNWANKLVKLLQSQDQDRCDVAKTEAEVFFVKTDGLLSQARIEEVRSHLDDCA